MNYRQNVLSFPGNMTLTKKTNSAIYLKAKYGPSKVTRIPLKLTNDLSCFTAFLIGDGHLRKDKYVLSIELTNKNILTILSAMIQHLFSVKTTIKKIKKRGNKKQTYHLTIYSKAIHDLFHSVFEIPKGKKSNIVQIPSIILAQNKSLQSAFIIGLLASEGSRKDKGRVRIASSSETLMKHTKGILTKCRSLVIWKPGQTKDIKKIITAFLLEESIWIL